MILRQAKDAFGNGVEQHLVRAALEAVAYQSVDVVAAMEADSGMRLKQIRVDGGRVKSDTRLTAGAAVRVPPIPDPVARDPSQKPRISDRDAAYGTVVRAMALLQQAGAPTVGLMTEPGEPPSR